MKKILVLLSAAFFLMPLANTSAQMMYGTSAGSVGVINQPLDAGEAAGQAIAQKLQAKTVACADLSQADYESLGDYYMGLMMGTSQDSMEQSIEKSYGTEYLKSMHVAMGERLSGCNTNVAFPAGMIGFSPTMGNGGYGMMNAPGMMGGYYGTYGWSNWITMILVWTLLVLGIVAAVKWLKK